MDDKKKGKLSLRKGGDNQSTGVWGKKSKPTTKPQPDKPKEKPAEVVHKPIIQVGQTHTLTVKNLMPFGATMDGEGLGNVFLPKKHMPESLNEGSELSVFLYQDSDDQIIATTQLPLVELNQCA